MDTILEKSFIVSSKDTQVNDKCTVRQITLAKRTANFMSLIEFQNQLYLKKPTTSSKNSGK